MLRRVALVRTDVLEKLSASIIRVTRIGELGTTLAVTRYRQTDEGKSGRSPILDTNKFSHFSLSRKHGLAIGQAVAGFP
jgi:hypothetical protein